MPKKKKHPKNMTNDELATHVFHPKVLKHAQEHLERLNKPKVSKKSVK